MVKVESDGNTMNILDGYTIPLAMECKTILLRQFVWVQRDILWELLPAAAKNLLAETKVPFFFNKIISSYIGLFVYSLRFFFWIHSFGSFDGYKALILKIFLPAIVYF